ncbi:MAG: glutamine amidotransferase-related protein [Candidatus Bathyarchaeia archaeon]
MNWKRDSLAYSEFVSPILAVVEPLEPCKVMHFLDVKAEDIGGYSKIILSGTTLRDFEAQKHLDRFQWLKTCEKPVLGICAGMQIISLIFGVPLTECMQVGMTEITTQKPNPLFEGTFQAYTLHSLSTSPSDAFDILASSAKCIQAIKHKQKPLYGVLFHPEVRNQTILSTFARLS